MSTAPDRPTWATIDTAAFVRNVDSIAHSLPDGSRLIAVLKANAYGHGATPLAKAIDGRVAMIATALLEEALELRSNGIASPLLLLGPATEAGLRLAFDHGITPGIPGPEELASVCRIANDRDVAIHLKLDSGMGRMGVIESELPDVIEMLRCSPRVKIEAIYTHFADNEHVPAQTANFDRMIATLRAAGIDAPLHHMANSPATLAGIVRPHDYVRCGIALYGEVMRWRTEIVRLKTLPPGHAIGYGMTFHTTRSSRIATLPVGYADGYSRALSNCGEVLVRGTRAPVVGRVSMDLITIDVTDVPHAALGDEVILLGDGITADEVAAKAGTISYEVFCRVSARVPRVYS